MTAFARCFASNPTPNPNAFASKGGAESDVTTDHPTNMQAHSATAETSHGHGHGHDGEADEPTPEHERLADSEPYTAEWVDYRPNLVEVQVTRNADGDMVGQWGDEEVIFPDLDTSLDWVLSTPVDVHLFEEVPIIKVNPQHSHTAQRRRPPRETPALPAHCLSPLLTCCVSDHCCWVHCAGVRVRGSLMSGAPGKEDWSKRSRRPRTERTTATQPRHREGLCGRGLSTNRGHSPRVTKEARSMRASCIGLLSVHAHPRQLCLQSAMEAAV